MCRFLLRDARLGHTAGTGVYTPVLLCGLRVRPEGKGVRPQGKGVRPSPYLRPQGKGVRPSPYLPPVRPNLHLQPQGKALRPRAREYSPALRTEAAGFSLLGGGGEEALLRLHVHLSARLGGNDQCWRGR